MDTTQGEQQAVLTAEDLVGLTDAFPRELVFVPEWGKSVWVWAYDLNGERDRWNDMQNGQDDADRINRGMIARVIAAVRQGGDMVDGKLPPPLFTRVAHWEMLKQQPLGVVKRLCEVSERLSGESFATQEQIAAFFGLLGQVIPCLRHIVSHCDACTDCPRNSQATCPLVTSQRLWLPTG